jgi:hypothetical protein
MVHAPFHRVEWAVHDGRNLAARVTKIVGQFRDRSFLRAQAFQCALRQFGKLGLVRNRVLQVLVLGRWQDQTGVDALQQFRAPDVPARSLSAHYSAAVLSARHGGSLS